MKPPQQASVAARLHNLIFNALSYKIDLDLILISSYKIILIPTLNRAFIH